jgi:hypothetical protein
LRKEALDRTMWRNCFRRGFEPVLRQNTEWIINFGMSYLKLSLYLWLRLRSILILCRFPTVCICDLSFLLMSRLSNLCRFYHPMIFRGIQIWSSLCTFINILYNLEYTTSCVR